MKLENRGTILCRRQEKPRKLLQEIRKKAMFHNREPKKIQALGTLARELKAAQPKPATQPPFSTLGTLETLIGKI
jgi:hypothetical protein